MSSRQRFLVGTVLVLYFLSMLIGGYVSGLPGRSFPQTSGEIQIDGLTAPVEILRDPDGIPHIYASTVDDLFFAQGYVHAQDRFWQMDFWRHLGGGRLSEMFGEAQLSTDRFLRSLGWGRLALIEWTQMDAETRRILEAYSAGVNAYLANHQGSELSLEYSILALLNPAYTVEPWQPVHSLTWAKVMAWDLGGNMFEEITRARLIQAIGVEPTAELYPAYPANHPYITGLDGFGGGLGSQAEPSTPDLALLQALPALESAQAAMQPLVDLLGAGNPEIGSNNWVISGDLTSTGMPLLANDPHLGVQMPSIWYEIGLHCTGSQSACPLNVTGFSFAGAPGVVIGHNQSIAWGFTNTGPDVQDLYIERINPDNPNQYEVNGAWVDMTIIEEKLRIAGGSQETLQVRLTRHGPVISDTLASLEDFGEGMDLPEPFAIALRWTALDEGSGVFPAIWRLNLAQNWDEFRAAAALFDVPSQNLVYADVDGNIGYQMPGLIPVRAKGNGTLPVPGWTDEYAWLGYIPFEQLPRVFNPPAGYIVTANNAVAGPAFPYFINHTWDYGYRAMRIIELIENNPGPISHADIGRIQGDNADLSAAMIVPVLAAMNWPNPDEAQAVDLLAAWDGQMHLDSGPAALYAVFWKNLLAEVFHDDLPEDFWPGGSSRYFNIVGKLLQEPNNAWWDDQSTPQRENRQEILRRTLRAALAEIQQLQGSDARNWRWGGLHTTTFRNGSLGESGIAPIEALFNRGPYPTSGGSSIVNATGWSPLEPYTVGSLPSMRMIVDMGNLAASLTMHTTGQSGHAYHPQYVNMADRWRLIQFHPMYWERADLEAAGAQVLVLRP